MTTPIFTERTFADLWSYTSFWTTIFVKRGELTEADARSFLRDYGGRCLAAQKEVYAMTLLLPYMEHIPWTADPHRARREDVQPVYDAILEFSCGEGLYLPITTRSVDERATEVERHLRATW